MLPAFAHTRRNSTLHAVVSGSEDQLNTLGDRYRIPVRASYDQYERCLKEVDAVYAVRAARRAGAARYGEGLLHGVGQLSHGPTFVTFV